MASKLNVLLGKDNSCVTQAVTACISQGQDVGNQIVDVPVG